MTFAGFPDGKVSFSRIPELFFGELLPQIDDLGELKVTLYALWKLESMEGDFRYLRESDFRADERFMFGLAATPEEAESALRESLERAVGRGTYLRVVIPRDEEAVLYFLNTSRGRAAVEAIRRGEWRPQESPTTAPVLSPERPSIYHLYEQNIGLITPLLSETLQEAEDTYPAEWIEEAFRIAVEKNIRNWRYIEAILRRWHERGYDVRKDRRDPEEHRQQYAEWEND
ncbi:MAG: DnaD domain protein [Chloroflexi bacterium]|nr:DnaD domain protein [Chloroflexota bacterium]